MLSRVEQAPPANSDLVFCWFARHPDGSLGRFSFSVKHGWIDMIERSSSSTAALGEPDAWEPLFIPSVGIGWRF